MTEMRDLIIGALVLFMLLVILNTWIADSYNRYAPDTAPSDVRFLQAANQTMATAGQMSDTAQSQPNQGVDVFGIPGLISTSVLSAAKLIFSVLNTFDALIQSGLDATGLGIGWMKSYLMAIFGVFVLFIFISLILRYRT